MQKTLIVMAIIVTSLMVQSTYAYQWVRIDNSNMCSGCVAVEPNPFAHYGNSSLNGIPIEFGAYQVHYLKHNEKPTYFDYNCWGCYESDYAKIFNETGIWYYPK
jgi:hypothetical protein